MARKKEYIEDEVIEKAMALFWRNGYEATSVRMLEKEMGINQFSIYSSFGNKQGVFLESIKSYRKKICSITDKLEKSNNGIIGLKQYFYDFIAFSRIDNFKKGCLVTNTFIELGEHGDPAIMHELQVFFNEIRSLMITNLKHDKSKSEKMVESNANYLAVSLLGLSPASKILNDKQLADFIETAFSNL
ncbi:Transcriptional regulator, TetR family [Arcticibacter svalbardensis MN12-7]|uniref:Transcriptional regulator, TetR family n=1 Tax=Arcticibacter svalbardensis MN12-7 TaxID=1150600 RepID=R9GP67_9SPHI|nr:TetR/AcrR family transcriptional regulator [Arcticibacter svalbardensis]EOR93518.1 Transcriptional regulator, TetR family [Arcticibacter svalbardensis MN12-7]